MDHPYGKQYGQEGNPRAYMTMRDYRNLPYQWGNQQPVERNPNPPRSMREYRDQWMSAPVYHVPSTETSKAWDEPRPREEEGLRYPSNQGETIHTISEKTLMREKLTILTRRLDEMEMKNQHNIHSVNEFSASQPSFYNHQSHGHYGENCQENVQILNQGRPPLNVPFGNPYIQNWKNHSNLPGKPYVPPTDQQQFTPTSQQQQPISLSPVEQAVLNLSKMIGTIQEEQKVLSVQTKQQIEALGSSVNRSLGNMHAEILRLSNQFVHPEEENLEEESQEEECLTETVLVEQAQLQPQEGLKVESLEAPEELQEAPVNFWPWTKEKENTALLTEKSSGHEGTQEPFIQAIPIDLDTIATAQATKIPLPAAPSIDQVYILPASQSQHKTPAAPKAKSNPLHVVQNFKELVASVHALATTSKTMATAYIAWHSGWFGCGFGFGFGTPGPRHF